MYLRPVAIICKRIIEKKTYSNINKTIIWISDFTILCFLWCGVIIIAILLFMKNMCDVIPYSNIITNRIYEAVIHIFCYFLEVIKKLFPNTNRRKLIYEKTTGNLYLERYYLFIKERDSFPFNIFLHKFINGDKDDIHDHPWGFFHIILSGGYWEYITVNENGETMDQGIRKVWRNPGYYNICSSDYKHKIVLGNSKPLTLFIPFKKEKNWGFWVPMIWNIGGPCNEGSIDNDKHLNSTQWTKISHKTYFEKNKKIK